MWRRAPDSNTVEVRASAVAVLQGVVPQEVWAFVRRAESSFLLDLPSDLSAAFTVAGTGPGVGEQQRFVYREGGTDVVATIEVTALEEGRWAEWRSVEEDSYTTRLEVALSEAGTDVTISARMLIEPFNAELARQTVASNCEQYAQRLEVLINRRHLLPGFIPREA